VAVSELNADKVLLLREPVAAHGAFESAWKRAKALTMAGETVAFYCEQAEDDRSLKQNRFYWGVVLKAISEQGRIEGQQYAAEAWHELFKRQFLGYRIRKVRVAGKKRLRVIRELRSTTDLSVKKFSEYLEKVLAFGATELAVVFESDWWE